MLYNSPTDAITIYTCILWPNHPNGKIGKPLQCCNFQ